MSTIIKIAPLGEVTALNFLDDYVPTLRYLQELVGGNIETAPTFDSRTVMVICEEGKLIGLERNQLATDILAPYDDDWIAGAAGQEDDTGDRRRGQSRRDDLRAVCGE